MCKSHSFLQFVPVLKQQDSIGNTAKVDQKSLVLLLGAFLAKLAKSSDQVGK